MFYLAFRTDYLLVVNVCFCWSAISFAMSLLFLILWVFLDLSLILLFLLILLLFLLLGMPLLLTFDLLTDISFRVLAVKFKIFLFYDWFLIAFEWYEYRDKVGWWVGWLVWYVGLDFIGVNNFLLIFWVK